MKVKFIPIVIGALGTVSKGLIKGREYSEMRGRVKTIKTTALLRSTRILRRFLETWGDLRSPKLQWKTISWLLCVNLSRSSNNMQKPESVLENETRKLLWDFELQTDHLIPARRPDLVIVHKKETRRIVDFTVQVDHRAKIDTKRKEKLVQRPTQRTKKLWNINVTVISIVFNALWTIPKVLYREWKT